MGFHRLVMEEGGAMRYMVKLGEAPVGGSVELRVSGAYLEHEVVLVFTAENFETPQLVSVVLTDPVDESEPIELDPNPTFTPPPVDPRRPADDVPEIPSPLPTTPTDESTDAPAHDDTPSPTPSSDGEA